jgi:signal transduction histidine kinase
MCKNGDRVWIAWTNQAIHDENGDVVEILSVGNDITERKKAEAELERVNRSLKAISKCNEAVVHAKEESALLNHVCQIIAEVGGYRMTWVGYAENDANRTVRPMAYNGFEDGYMAIVNVTWEDTERGRGPVGSAIRTGKPCVIRYATTDTNFLPWREDALKRGYNSVLGLPLIQDGHSFGALAIYSEQPDAFDEKETIMLQDLANNLTYGIISLRNEVKRAEAESALKAAKADAELYVDLMGHDINNMNQISLGFLELAHNIIDMNGKLGEDDVVLLNKAMDSLNNSSQLIDNVRKLQKEKMGMYRLEVIDVGAVIEDAAKQFHRIPDREIEINYSPDQHCLDNANGLLKDVFINLIGNAVKHSKGDLVINILMGEVIDDAKTYCCVDVEDNGPGIPDMLKTTLFDRLNLTTTRAKGKGFGLCLIKMLVDDYHGRFWVEDRVQGDHTKGARFVVMLPVVEK